MPGLNISIDYKAFDNKSRIIKALEFLKETDIGNVEMKKIHPDCSLLRLHMLLVKYDISQKRNNNTIRINPTRGL